MDIGMVSVYGDAVIQVDLGINYNASTYKLHAPYDYDSLFINKKIYRHVAKISAPGNNDTATYVLYTQNEGVIRIKTLKHEVWDIIR
jgi:hypothetical protein